MTYNPKDEVFSSKNEKMCAVEFLQKSIKSRKSMKFAKEILRGKFRNDRHSVFAASILLKKILKPRFYKVGKVKKFRGTIAI